jgi:hypothetical protein
MFAHPSTAEKFRELGFSAEDASMKLTIENVSIVAIAHPFRGVALFITTISPRTMSQYETFLPEISGPDKIAGLIYINILMNSRDYASAFREHFVKMGIPLFQS